MKALVYIILLICFFPLHARALSPEVLSDSVSVFERVLEREEHAAFFYRNSYENPSQKIDEYSFSLSDIKVLYSYRYGNKASVPQLGKGHSIAELSYKSDFKMMKNTLQIWGDVNYFNGVKKSVVWNSSSDFELIYPYYMADTVGGNLFTEQYSFSGGCGGRLKRMQLGGELNYRALHEFRQIDPRPRNIVADLRAKLGASLPVFYEKYNVGAFITAGRYNQQGTVSFYNELGGFREYQMQGLGGYFERFEGGKVEVLYRGNLYGGKINLLPKQKEGVELSLNYENFRFERIVKDLNEVPINQFLDHSFSAETGYLFRKNNHSWGGRVRWAYKNKQGETNVVGEAVSGEYPILAKLPMFWSELMSGNFELSYGLKKKKLIAVFISQVGMMRRDEKNLYPQKNGMSFRYFLADFNTSVTYRPLKNLFLETNTSFSYKKNTAKQNDVWLGYLMPSAALLFAEEFKHLAADCLNFQIAQSTHFMLRNKTAIYLSFYYSSALYKEIKIVESNIKIVTGLKF